MDDTTMRTQFAGADCVLCKRPNWMTKSKGLGRILHRHLRNHVGSRKRGSWQSSPGPLAARRRSPMTE
jgi:hypothetical protein